MLNSSPCKHKQNEMKNSIKENLILPSQVNLKRRFPTAQDLRIRARKRLPNFAFEYVDGGAGSDTGIARKLPVLDDTQEPEDMQGNARNIYEVYVNKRDKLLVEDLEIEIGDLKEGAKSFINNNGRNPELSDSPDKAIVSLINSRGTSYEMYISVQNELTAAYSELRNEESIKKHGLKYV